MILTVYRIEREFRGKTMRLSPQIPETRASFENDVQPRICVCPSIYGCILAAEIDWQTEKTQKFFLYKAIINTNKVDVYQPTEKDVPDVFATGEFWLLDETEFALQGVYERAPQNEVSERYMRCSFTRIDPPAIEPIADGPWAPVVYGTEDSFSFISRGKFPE